MRGHAQDVFSSPAFPKATAIISCRSRAGFLYAIVVE